MRHRVYLRVEDDSIFEPPVCDERITQCHYPLLMSLRDSIAHLFIYRECVLADAAVAERILPDGLPRLIVSFSAAGCSARLVGPQTRAVDLAFRDDVDSISVQLRPGACASLFRIPAHELVSRCFTWDTIASPAHRQLPEQLLECAGDGRRVDVLQRTLASLEAGESADELRRVRTALRLLSAGRSKAQVAEEIGVGDRRLQQLFRTYVGLSPHGCARLFRFHACLRHLRHHPRVEWSDFALQRGYYDQAHLVNDFRALSGFTPAQFVRTIADFSNMSH